MDAKLEAATNDPVRYCRRQDASGKPCYKPIAKRNALSWCEDCRAARLPFWPANDAVTPEIK